MKKFIFLLAITFLAGFNFLSAQEALPLDKELKATHTPTKADVVELAYTTGTVGKISGFSLPVGTTYVSGCISFTKEYLNNLHVVGGVINALEIAVPNTTEQYMPNLTSYRIWIKTALNGAVLYEETVEPSPGNSWKHFDLATPYTITDEPLVVGYTAGFTLTTAGNRYPLWYEEGNYQPGAFNRMTSSNPNGHGAGATFGVNTAGSLGIIVEVTVPSLPTKDLCVTMISTTTALKLIGTQHPYTVMVVNAGKASQSNFTVQLFDENDNVLGSKTVTTALAAGASTPVSINYTANTAGVLNVRGKVVLDGDEYPDNDVSKPLKERIYPIKPMAYCDHAINSGIGSTTSNTRSSAIGFPTAPAGKLLTAIEVGIYNADGITGTIEFWVRSALTGANLVQATCAPVNGWNTVELPEPFVIPSGPIFIGYSITHTGYALGASNATTLNCTNGGHFKSSASAAWDTYCNNYGGTNPLNYNATIIATIESTCKPVTNLKAEYNNNCNAELTWTAPEGATKFNVYRNNVIIAENVETPYYTDESGTPTQGYTWSVTVVCTDEESIKISASLPACITPPPAVTNFDVKYETDCSAAKLTWSATTSELAKGYNVYRGTDLIATVELLPEPFYVDAEYDNSGSTVWTVKIKCDFGVESAPASKTLGICLGINDIVKTFSITPNPATNNITISAENHFHTVEVLSFLGQLVIAQPNNGTTAEVDISSLTNGVYFVRIISENGTSVQKFVKQ